MRDFELVADEDYKKGKYDNYFELEKNLVVENPKFISVEQRTGVLSEWINRIESISGKGLLLLGKPATPNASPLRLNPMHNQDHPRQGRSKDLIAGMDKKRHIDKN